MWSKEWWHAGGRCRKLCTQPPGRGIRCLVALWDIEGLVKAKPMLMLLTEIDVRKNALATWDVF